MVTIVDYKTYQREDGSEFHALIVQGGLEAVKSQETQRTYFTARTANVLCTFDENTCKTLIGNQIPGSIQKQEVDPYEYTIPQTGELVTLSHRYVYLEEGETIVKENVVEKEFVA